MLGGVAPPPRMFLLFIVAVALLQHCCGVGAAAPVVSDDAAILVSISDALGIDFWDFRSEAGGSATTMAEVCASPQHVKCDEGGELVTEIWLLGPRSKMQPHTIDNVLEGVAVAAFARLSELRGLRVLRLTGIGLTGSLPEQWGDEMNDSLVDLDLELNRLIGSVPSTYGNLRNLQFLKLGGNQLSGAIPVELGQLRNLQELWLSSNDLSGNVPLLCSRAGLYCDFTGNPSMCEAGQRVYFSSCVACEHCVHGGGCSAGFDTYLCSSCMPGYYFSRGLCVSCSKGMSSSLVAFLSITLGLGLAMTAFFVRQKCLKRKVYLPSFRLGMSNQVIIKQIGSMLQLTSLLANMSFSLPSWFKSMSNMLSAFALPISFDTPCVSGLETLARWHQGLLLAVFLAAGVFLLVHARRICRWTLPSSAFGAMTPVFFVTLQTLAGVIVTQSAVLLLPLSLNVNELVGDAIDCGLQYGYLCPRSIVEGVISFTVAIGLAVSVILVIQHASAEYGAKRAEIEASGNAGGTTKYEDADSLLPFWGSFCTPYVPQSACHESKAIRRKVLTFFVSSISVLSVLWTQSVQESGRLRLGPISFTLPIQDEVLPAIVPSISASVDALSFNLVQLMYLRHVLRRPYVSDTVSTSSYDPLNEAELMGVRALCWGAFVFAVKEIISTSMSLRASETTGNVLCVIVLLALLMSQRPLFYGVAKGVGKRVSIAASAATLWCLHAFSVARESDINITDERVRSDLEKRHGDESVRELIQAMRDSDSPTDTLKLQVTLATTMLHALPEKERQRWAHKVAATNEKERGGFRRMLRWVVMILAVVFSAFVALISLFLLVWYSCTTTFMRWVFLALLCLVMLLMEWLIWRARLDERRSGTAEALSGSKSGTSKMDDDEVRDLSIDCIELVDNPMMVGGKIVDKTGGKHAYVRGGSNDVMTSTV